MKKEQTAAPWIRFKDEKPTESGLYEWRVPSDAVPGLVLIVAANMRMRGAGFETVLSPEFDYWDGYRVLVQCDVQWRESLMLPQIYDNTPAVLSIEGLEISACSHCGKTPRIKAYQAASMGGIALGPRPWNLNTWQFSCCAWGTSPSMGDPREIERIRRETRGKHAPALLRALQAVLADCISVDNDSGLSPEVGKMVRAAIGEATGDVNANDFVRQIAKSGERP